MTARPTRTTPKWLLNGVLPIDMPNVPSDVIAGATLAALAIPEVMGYAKIAGTPVVTGLYTLLLPILAFAILGSSRHLVVGADSATAAILATGLVATGVAAGSTAVRRDGVARRADVRRRAHRRAPAQARVHRQLPVAQRAHRLPDRRRYPGGDGPGGGDVRGRRRERHDAREVREHPPGDPDRDQRPHPGRLHRGPRHDPRPGSGQQEIPGALIAVVGAIAAELLPRPRRRWRHDLGTVPPGLPASASRPRS